MTVVTFFHIPGNAGAGVRVLVHLGQYLATLLMGEYKTFSSGSVQHVVIAPDSDTNVLVATLNELLDSALNRQREFFLDFPCAWLDYLELFDFRES